jgi:hypothetical protein
MPERDLFEQPRRLTLRDRAEAFRGYRAERDGEHVCAVCGAPASFGSGVSLRNEQPGTWLCFKHWQAGVG